MQEYDAHPSRDAIQAIMADVEGPPEVSRPEGLRQQIEARGLQIVTAAWENLPLELQDGIDRFMRGQANVAESWDEFKNEIEVGARKLITSQRTKKYAVKAAIEAYKAAKIITPLVAPVTAPVVAAIWGVEAVGRIGLGIYRASQEDESFGIHLKKHWKEAGLGFVAGLPAALVSQVAAEALSLIIQAGGRTVMEIVPGGGLAFGLVSFGAKRLARQHVSKLVMNQTIAALGEFGLGLVKGKTEQERKASQTWFNAGVMTATLSVMSASKIIEKLKDSDEQVVEIEQEEHEWRASDGEAPTQKQLAAGKELDETIDWNNDGVDDEGVKILDLNDDGEKDVIIFSDGKMAYAWGNGSGFRFDRHDDGFDEIWRMNEIGGESVWQPVAFDLTGDGIMNLFSSGPNSWGLQILGKEYVKFEGQYIYNPQTGYSIAFQYNDQSFTWGQLRAAHGDLDKLLEQLDPVASPVPIKTPTPTPVQPSATPIKTLEPTLRPTDTPTPEPTLTQTVVPSPTKTPTPEPTISSTPKPTEELHEWQPGEIPSDEVLARYTPVQVNIDEDSGLERVYYFDSDETPDLIIDDDEVRFVRIDPAAVGLPTGVVAFAKDVDGSGVIEADELQSLYDFNLPSAGAMGKPAAGKAQLLARVQNPQEPTWKDIDGDGQMDVHRQGEQWSLDTDADGNFETPVILREIEGEERVFSLDEAQEYKCDPDGHWVAIDVEEAPAEESPPAAGETIPREERIKLEGGRRLALGPRGGVEGLLNQMIVNKAETSGSSISDWRGQEIGVASHQIYLNQILPNLREGIPMYNGSPVVYAGESLGDFLARAVDPEVDIDIDGILAGLS
ncbi:VCBS repeat-containing protein [Patescibacteria group bacterium]|nr:VCBS repeat-containing protein [Patescibacteria group bacterium]MBU1931139.1 VCBS repeat-containing protein [Patescibacteria group bacterium]